ncbi:hypothetical protein N657DRAFT_642269, partial [Parathielavia appendiculata]
MYPTRLERAIREILPISVLGSRAWIFGGELLPRQPVDNRLDLIELTSSQGEHRDQHQQLP